MGSGKTTVGQLLARQLAWRFEDLDARIEEHAGLSIPAIFERLGEPAFRQIESEQIEAALGRGGGIARTYGAGARRRHLRATRHRERLRAAGAVVVWLDCPVELLLARCATMTNRPLFRDEASFRRSWAAACRSTSRPTIA